MKIRRVFLKIEMLTDANGDRLVDVESWSLMLRENVKAYLDKAASAKVVSVEVLKREKVNVI